MTFYFLGFFAVSSWLNPKCWCSLIPLDLLLGSLMSLHLQDWLLPVGWSLACLYLQPRLFSWAVSQTLYTAVAMDGYGENTVGCLFSCVSCAWWCHHHPSSQLNIPFSSSLLNTSNLVLQEPHNISVCFQPFSLAYMYFVTLSLGLFCKMNIWLCQYLLGGWSLFLLVCRKSVYYGIWPYHMNSENTYSICYIVLNLF